MSQKMSLNQVLAPQLQQSLNLLQAPMLELQAMIDQELQTNPVLEEQAALDMVYVLLRDAANRGADVIATTCPLCNVNIELYQKQVNREYGTDFSIPAVYFTQLMGLAFGITAGRLGIGKELVSAAPLLSFARGT